jgi:long-chain acyl-CoA synthetase
VTDNKRLATNDFLNMTSNDSHYSQLNYLPEVWEITAKKYPNIVALHDPHSNPEVKITFEELRSKIQLFAAGLQVLGLQSTQKVSLIADNSYRWFIADQGIMTAGAVDVVRSSAADKQELLYIIQDSDSTSLVVENLKTLNKLRPELDDLPIQFVTLLSDETTIPESSLKILNFEQIMLLGKDRPLQKIAQNRQNLATLLYTSGTTGQPKGAMLSHGNLLHQVVEIQSLLRPEPADIALSILPSWHAYERSCEYFLLAHGCTITYTNIRSFKKDLKQFQPHFMVGVPRLWESLYEAMQKQFSEQPEKKQKLIQFFFKNSEKYILAKRIADGMSLNNLAASGLERFLARLKAIFVFPLHALGDRLVYSKVREGVGGRIKTLVSGGGSLAMVFENFYETISIPLLVGYGLTETSPVTNARSPEYNLRGSSGKPLPQTEIKIVDPESRQPKMVGEKGLVLIRGAQVMQGYYKKPEATAKAIDPDGWFDSGDLGWVTQNNDLVLTGRVKDTIVLTNGENIEPQPIEDACLRSIYIDQIMLVGQDCKCLGALIVPNLDNLKQWAQQQQLGLNFPEIGTSLADTEKSDLNNKAVRDLFRQELTREVKNRAGYRADDRIGEFTLILKPFSIDNGMMTQTMKIKRSVVTEYYQQAIEKMFV